LVSDAADLPDTLLGIELLLLVLLLRACWHTAVYLLLLTDHHALLLFPWSHMLSLAAAVFSILGTLRLPLLCVAAPTTIPT
jgi:hypothetical protein